MNIATLIEKRMRVLGSLVLTACLTGIASFGWSDVSMAPVPEAENVESERCIYARKVRSIDVVDEQMLALRGTANRYWLSRLPNKCAGLDDRLMLQVDRYGSRLCVNDRFVAAEHDGLFSTSCRFGEFEPVSKETVHMLKQAADEQRS